GRCGERRRGRAGRRRPGGPGGPPTKGPPGRPGPAPRRGVTPAAAVYTPGPILSELLGGQPPFRADTPLETMLQVMEKDPASLRLLNPRVARDLETVVHKCLDKDPERRYRSAADLAEDLRRPLHGEPIQARPVGAVERVLRWCGRNPALALASSAAAVLFLVATGILLVLVVHESLYLKELSEKGGELLAANEKINRARAEAEQQ